MKISRRSTQEHPEHLAEEENLFILCFFPNWLNTHLYPLSTKFMQPEYFSYAQKNWYNILHWHWTIYK